MMQVESTVIRADDVPAKVGHGSRDSLITKWLAWHIT